MGKHWWISKIQNHGDLFRPNNGKQWKTTFIFACFLWFWKTCKLAFINTSKHSFVFLTNVGLTDFRQIFFVTPSDCSLHQIISPSMCNPDFQCWFLKIYICGSCFDLHKSQTWQESITKPRLLSLTITKLSSILLVNK